MSAQAAIDLDLLAIDPRPCGNCGLLLDRLLVVDHGDGFEHLCPDIEPDDLTLLELERRHELRIEEEAAVRLARWEMADPRDRWRHTGEPPPPDHVRNGPITPTPPPMCEEHPYRPDAATVDVFRHLVMAGDIERLTAWLAGRPKDAPLLLALIESPSS